MLSNAVASDTLSLTQSCCRLPTAIQYECIPLILGGGDVLAAAETGSGQDRRLWFADLAGSA